jgi:hypothetical protein
MDAAETIRAYYDTLRDGDPLGPFFAAETDDDDGYVKFGIGERLLGSEAIVDGLAAQTERTTDWAVDSRDLRVTERSTQAWFSDDVSMAWMDTEAQVRYEFDTRWSGTLERRDGAGDPAEDGEWRFVGMHVSTAGAV